MYTKVLLETYRKRNCMGDLGVDRTTILNEILREILRI